MPFAARFRQGMKAAIAIWIAFVPSSLAWGIAAQAHGLTLGEVVLTPPRLDDIYGTRHVDHLLTWRDRLVEAPGRVADASSELLRGGVFDFAWINFGSAHKAGHHLWDPATVVDGAIAARDERALQEGLADVYEAVDRAIGRTVDALPPDADIIVFSPTGMGATTSRADLLPGMVDAVLSGGSRAAARPAASSPIWALRSAVPASLRQWVARALPDDTVADIATRLYFRRDWSQTRDAFMWLHQ